MGTFWMNVYTDIITLLQLDLHDIKSIVCLLEIKEKAFVNLVIFLFKVLEEMADTLGLRYQPKTSSKIQQFDEQKRITDIPANE